MDGISVAANIFAVIEAAQKTAEALKIILSHRHAPQEVLQFINEISDFRIVAVKAQEVIEKSNGSGGIDILDEFKARLKSILERALRDVSEMNRIINSEVLITPPNPITQAVKISRIKWFKRQKRMKTLLEGIHTAKLDITSHLTLFTASHLPMLRSTLSGISLNGQNLTTTVQQVKDNSTSQYSDLQSRLQSIQSSIGHISSQLSPGSRNAVQGQKFEFRTSIYATDDNKCPPACGCKCHVSLTFRLPLALQNLLGSLFIGYHGTPLLTDVSCDEHRCRRNGNRLLTVSYYFPAWFLHRMIVFKGTSRPTEDCVISFRTPRVVNTTSVFYCAELGNVDGLRELFIRGMASPFDVDCVTGQSPLYTAAWQGHVKACQFLLAQHADPETPVWHSSTTVLDIVWERIVTDPEDPVSVDFKRIFAHFLEDGDSLQHRRFTALHKIILRLSSIPLRSQLEHSTADIDAQCSQGETPLHWAVKLKDLISMKLLVDHGAQINLPDSNGYTPVHLASNLFPEGLRYLLGIASTINEAQPDFTHNLVHARTNFGDTALLRACVADHTGLSATLLLEHSADKNGCRFGSTGATPLLVSVQHNLHANIKILLEWEADCNLKDEEKQGILHVAACFSDIKTLNILHEADLRIRTLDDKDILGHVPLENFDLDRPNYLTEDPEMRERCRQVLLRLLEQQGRNVVLVEEVVDIEENRVDSSAGHSGEDVFFDCAEVKE